MPRKVFLMIKQIFIAFDDSADDETAEATTESEADSANKLQLSRNRLQRKKPRRYWRGLLRKF